MPLGIAAGEIMQLQINLLQNFHKHIIGTRQDSRRGMRGGQKKKKVESGIPNVVGTRKYYKKIQHCTMFCNRNRTKKREVRE